MLSLQNQFEANSLNPSSEFQNQIDERQKENIIPFLAFRSDYAFSQPDSDLITKSSIIQSTSCWIGQYMTKNDIICQDKASTETSSSSSSSLMLPKSSLVCEYIHQISYPEDFPMKLLSETVEVKKKSEKKKKKVTFQLDEVFSNDLPNVTNLETILDQKPKEIFSFLGKVFTLFEFCFFNLLILRLCVCNRQNYYSTD